MGRRNFRVPGYTSLESVIVFELSMMFRLIVVVLVRELRDSFADSLNNSTLDSLVSLKYSVFDALGTGASVSDNHHAIDTKQGCSTHFKRIKLLEHSA